MCIVSIKIIRYSTTHKTNLEKTADSCFDTCGQLQPSSKRLTCQPDTAIYPSSELGPFGQEEFYI